VNPPRCILEINTRAYLRSLTGAEAATLADVPDSHIEEWATLGFDAVWPMGVWLPSAESRRIALEHRGLHEEYARALPDWNEEDVVGSPYAACGYEVSPALGGAAALEIFRARLAAHGIRLILDFIPNHTARDHPWVREHPEWYVRGTESDLARENGNWFLASTVHGPVVLGHGRDPNFPGWTDTAQLDYSNAELQAQMRAELARLTTLCDGVRCDVAMLVLNSVFERTWGRSGEEFWPRAIEETRRVRSDFFFIAESYWHLESDLLKAGFDLAYDKYLLDDIAGGPPLRRDRFSAVEAEHRFCLRFLENHDEPRIASRLNPHRVQAAAMWTFSLPSSRLLYEGQMEGRRVRLPVQLVREPNEPPNDALRSFYCALLRALRCKAVREGAWRLLEPQPAWSGNESHHAILGQGYDLGDDHVRIFVNWSSARSQCWVPLGIAPLSDREVVLTDLLGAKHYVRDGVELGLRGLYLDLEPWETHFFTCEVRRRSPS